MSRKFLFFPLLAAILGCQSYRPLPIDWAREHAVWLEKGALTFDTLEDVARLALVGNPELNALRLKRAASEKVAAQTGWWEDPEISGDLLRIVNPAENPHLGGVALSLTIPLSGVTGLERRAAEAYAAADAADILAAEWDLRASARQAALRLLFARETVQVLRTFEADARVASALESAARLAEAGELSKIELASARLRRHQRVHRLREAEASEAEAEQALRQLLGIAPAVDLAFRGNVLQEDGEKALSLQGPLALVRHPRVQAAVSRLAGGEAALETEIRRQYPDLKVGPTYSHEEGMDRLGFAAGLTIPLWNRNRKGIAEAEGVRDEARFAAIRAWREVVQEADAAQRHLARLTNHPPEPSSSRAETEALLEAGEISPLEYLVVHEEALDGELMERDWRRDVWLAKENVRKFATEGK